MLTKMKRLADAVEVVPAAKHRRVAADAPAETFLALLGNARGYIYAGCVSKLAKKDESSHSLPLSKRPNSCSGPICVRCQSDCFAPLHRWRSGGPRWSRGGCPRRARLKCAPRRRRRLLGECDSRQG